MNIRQLLLFQLILDLIITISCNNQQTKTVNKIVRKPTTSIDTISIDDTLFKGNDVVILGNKNLKGEDAINRIKLKFEPLINFNNFHVNISENTKRAKIQPSINPISKQFRTRIKEGYKQGINFAGHYTFIIWGCGSDCQMSALIDNNTGIFYDGIDAESGFDFKKNSRMIIANPPPADSLVTHSACNDCPPFHNKPTIYIWNEKSKKFIKRT